MVKVEKFSHYFKVSNYPRTFKPVLDDFSRSFLEYGLEKRHGRFFRVPVRIYGAANRERTEYRFHINAFDAFLLALAKKGVRETEYDVIEHPIPDIDPVTHYVLPEWKAREDQLPVLEYLCRTNDNQSKFVALQTGKGKSFCAMQAAAMRQSRVVMVVGAKYIEKWIVDLKKTYKLKKKDYLAIRGSKALIDALSKGLKNKIKAKFILVSNTTFRNWMDAYEEGLEYMYSKGYPCPPDRYMEVLKGECRAIDEVHEDFHFNFKLDLYTHCKWSISLSATLINRDEFKRRMYELAYPKADRYEPDEYDKYVNAKSLIYQMEQPRKIRCVDGNGRYSHVMFEQNMMRNPTIMRNYMLMIKEDLDRDLFNEHYISIDTGLILVSTVEFAEILTAYLKQAYPNLVVQHYVSGDDYSNLMESDICVSTPQSAGTAVDKPNLMYALLTIAVSSIQRNVQGFGRLRKIKDGRNPRFTYLVCDDIPKHVTYHIEKEELLSTRALNYRRSYYRRPI